MDQVGSISTPGLDVTVEQRIADYRGDLAFYKFLGVVSASVATTLFSFLWANFNAAQSDFVKELIGGCATLLTTGTGGAFFKKVSYLNTEIREGQDWLSLYKQTLGPPIASGFAKVEEKLLSWLEG